MRIALPLKQRSNGNAKRKAVVLLRKEYAQVADHDAVIPAHDGKVLLLLQGKKNTIRKFSDKRLQIRPFGILISLVQIAPDVIAIFKQNVRIPIAKIAQIKPLGL